MEDLILEIKEYRNLLPKQLIKTLRGQAISGDIKGAKKGLEKIKRRVEKGEMGYGNSRSKVKKRKNFKKY